MSKIKTFFVETRPTSKDPDSDLAMVIDRVVGKFMSDNPSARAISISNVGNIAGKFHSAVISLLYEDGKKI